MFNLDLILLIAVLVAAVWKYQITWKILKFYWHFLRAKKFKLKRFYITFLSFLVLSIVFYKVIIVLWLLGVCGTYKTYFKINDLKFKGHFETVGFKPAPYFLSKEKSPGKTRVMFHNTQTVGYWLEKKPRLEVLLNSNIEYIGHGPKKSTMVIVLTPPVSKSKIYKDKSNDYGIRLKAVFDSININIVVKKVIESYAFVEVLFDSRSSNKVIESKKDEISRRLGLKKLEIGHRDGFFSWKIVHAMSVYKFWEAFQEAKKKAKGRIPVFIGKSENPIIFDLLDSFHWLIVGSTGGGKSNIVNCLISALLMNPKRNIAQYYFLDPKEVELIKYAKYGIYRGKKAEIMAELRGLEKEMNARYNVMARDGADEISKCKTRFGYKIIIVEEIADMMLDSEYKTEFADIMQSLGQKSRAAGFRIILITQAPYRDVIKGPIKVNFANRIVGPMPDKPASLVALGDGRAAELSGEAGEMILKMTGFNGRIKTPWMSDEDIEKVFKALEGPNLNKKGV
jgi:hypothetical protein